jgi:L-alanine-DL-glutamate epimerase-like enolase superfamily enzyme
VIAGLEASARTIPTDAPESDGTLEWDQTTIVLVRVVAGEHSGLGYTYGDASIAEIVTGPLAAVVCGRDPMDVPGTWSAMRDAMRNAGSVGAGAMAISAIDIALWDLKARILGVALCSLLGRAHDGVPVYGSGGFTSYDDERLASQLGGWVSDGIPRVKMKVGRDPDRDERRVDVARAAIGGDAELMVDANGAWDLATAARMAEAFARFDVRWFEEPVSSDDPDGLRELRGRVPGMAIAAGEYATSAFALRALLGCVDVLQADVTRCGGITGFMQADALCFAHGTPLSAHCAPALAVHPMAASQQGGHIEWFHDHVRIESRLFEGALEPVDGALRPDRARPGHGMALRRADADRFRVSPSDV